MSEKERYDLESRISAARCELEDAKKNIAELHEIMERQAESNARLIAEALKKDDEIGRLQGELSQAQAERDELKKELDAMRNELCYLCGKYRDAHNGACDGCRWEKR